MLDTWTWREVSAPWVSFPPPEFPGPPSCAALGMSQERPMAALQRQLLLLTCASAQPLGPLRVMGLSSFPLPISLLPSRESLESLPYFLYCSCSRLVIFSFLGTNSSPILCKLLGYFCNLLFQPRIVQVCRTSSTVSLLELCVSTPWLSRI